MIPVETVGTLLSFGIAAFAGIVINLINGI
jgi:hypothetical protein